MIGARCDGRRLKLPDMTVNFDEITEMSTTSSNELNDLKSFAPMSGMMIKLVSLCSISCCEFESLKKQK